MEIKVLFLWKILDYILHLKPALKDHYVINTSFIEAVYRMQLNILISNNKHLPVIH